MDKLNSYRQVFAALPDGCTAAEVNLICKTDTILSARRGELTSCTASEKNMFFLRATGQATSVVYSENLEADPRELIAMALENASVVDTGARQPMLENVQDRHVAESFTPMPTDELIEKAKQFSLLPGVMECTLTEAIRHSHVLNSLGTETEQLQPNYTLSLSVPGKGEDNYKVAECSRHRLADIDTGEMLRRLQEENALSHEELPFIRLPSGSYDTVISAAVTVNIMNTAWQLFAQRLMDNGRSPIRVGEKLGSNCLSIADSAVCPWSGYDFTIDSEGVRGADILYPVKNGVVTDTLKTLKQGTSTGNAGHFDLFSGNINTELISVPRNVFIVPGEETPEALLAKMGTGIHLTYSMDEFHSLNIPAGTFSIPCGGVYYENGVAVGRLQQMNLCGSFRKLLPGVEAVGSDMSMKGMWPHYDYCFGGPSLLIRSAEFAM